MKVTDSYEYNSIAAMFTDILLKLLLAKNYYYYFYYN